MVFPTLSNLLGTPSPAADHSYRTQWNGPSGHYYEFEMRLGLPQAPIAELFQLFLDNFCDAFPMGGAKAGVDGRLGKRPIALNLTFALPAYMPRGIMNIVRGQLPPILSGGTYQIVYNHVVVTGLDRKACNFIVTTTNVHIFEGSVRHGLLIKDGQLVMRQEGWGNDTAVQRLLNFGSAGPMWTDLGYNFARILVSKGKLRR